VDCWVVVSVTSLRDWLDNAAVESAPVCPFVQKPPCKVTPGCPGPADVGQKIWASTLGVNPTNSGMTAALAAKMLRYCRKFSVFSLPLIPRPSFPRPNVLAMLRYRKLRVMSVT